jgi:hypothetical protein
MIGVDISAAQPNFPTPWYAQWGFVVCKATEGHDYHDPTFTAKFFDAQRFCSHAGAYHYARPGDGFNGVQQADFFADTVLAAGFRPGFDIWQLDCETKDNEGVAPGRWREFIASFMHQATTRLGSKGTLYAGYYFWLNQLGGDHAILAPYRWWLPWYGPNDGEIHLPTALLPQHPFIQQFTSHGGLDRNVVDDGAWSTWFQAPVPKPVPTPVHSGGIVMDLAHVRFATVPLTHKGFALFEGVFDAGVAVAECGGSVHGPDPDAGDGWWDWSIDGSIRVQPRGPQSVIITGFFPRWKDGDPVPQVHVYAVPA